VTPLRLKMEQHQGFLLWDYRTYGSPPIAVTNQDGIAEVNYPLEVLMEGELQPTTHMMFQVQHADFVGKVSAYQFGSGKPRKVSLEPGCEVRVTAVNEETRRPLQDFGVIVAGDRPAELWADAEGGGRRTRGIREGTWQTMLVQPQADGPTLFSEVLPIRAKRQRTLNLKNVWLSPGAVLRGMLSQNVPRPVSGYVVAEAVPSPAGERDAAENPSLVWYDWAEIAEDGSFEFESLPRGGEVHLMAFCDGWLAETNRDLNGADHFKMGQLFKLDAQSVDVELKMEPAGTLEVQALAPDGTPLTEGAIASLPNQRFSKGGIGLLGQRLRSIHLIENQFLPPDKRREPEDYGLEFHYRKRVNPDGVTVLTGLPLDFPLAVFLYHERFRLAGTARRSEGVVHELSSPQPEQLTLKTIVAKPEMEKDTNR